MRRLLPALTLFTFLFFHATALHAQPAKGKSLLWKISGNGMKQPSYLFGTMHVNDREAFYFEDSLYTFLERAEAFAMELNPDSLNDLFTAVYNGDLNLHDESQADQKLDSLLSKIRQKDPKAPPLNYKKLKSLMGKLVAPSQEKSADGMDVFMDAFLFKLASSKEKKVYGLEKVAMQLHAIKALSDGVNPDHIEELLENWDTKSESPLSKYYYKEDLDSLHYFLARYFTESAMELFLYHRNEGMVKMMDSIMHAQSLFTAVGAGHLPGPRGLISLLRQQGYKVEPVFSEKRIYAGDIVLPDAKKKWSRLTDKEQGFTVETPGPMTEQPRGGGRTVRYYYDLGEGKTYMTITGRMTKEERDAGVDSFFNGQIKAMLDYGSGILLSGGEAHAGQLTGRESVMLMKDKSYTRVTEYFRGQMFYMLALSSLKKEKLYDPVSVHFMASLNLMERVRPDWSKDESSKEGFRIEFPGKPKYTPAKSVEGKSSLASHVYSDASTGIDYSVYLIRPSSGHVFKETEQFFQSYISSIEEEMDKSLVTIVDTSTGGYPARFYSAGPSKGRMMQGIIVKRDNIGYYVSAEYETLSPDQPDVRRFLSSFAITELPGSDWKTAASPDHSFSSWMPDAIINGTEDEADSLTDRTLGTFVATEPYTSRVYSVEVTALNPYYWVSDVSVAFDRIRDQILTEDDTLVGYTVVRQNGLEGRDLIFRDTTQAKDVHCRFFLNGDRSYILRMSKPVLPLTGQRAVNEERYFNEFRVSELKPMDWLTKNTPKRIFDDLQSQDSVVFSHAYDALNAVVFDSTHIRMLMEKTLLPYRTINGLKDMVNNRLFNVLDKLYNEGEDPVEDPWVLDFIRQHYADPGSQIRGLQYDWLSLLAAQHHEEAYSLINELLKKQFPVSENYYYFYSMLEGQPELSRLLFPALFEHITDTIAGSSILSLAMSMIDSSRMTIKELDTHWPAIDKLMRKLLAETKLLPEDSYDYEYRLEYTLPLLGYFKQKKADDLLLAFQQVKQLNVKKYALVTLFKEHHTVSQPDLKKLLSKDQFTIELYELLKEAGKTSLIPPGIMDQKKIAKGYLYNAVMDEEDNDGMKPEFIYIKTVEREVEGVKKRYFIYRVNLRYGEDEEDSEPDAYLAVAGPFDTDQKKITIPENIRTCGIYYDEPFDGLRLDEFFQKFLDQFLEE